MKKLTFLAFVLVLMVSTVQAQRPANLSFNVHVPFDFVAGRTTMPAGDYVVQLPARPGPLVIGPASGRGGRFVNQLTAEEKWNGRPQLSFDQVGGTYYLTAVSAPQAGVRKVLQDGAYKHAVQVASSTTKIVEGR